MPRHTDVFAVQYNRNRFVWLETYSVLVCFRSPLYTIRINDFRLTQQKHKTKLKKQRQHKNLIRKPRTHQPASHPASQQKEIRNVFRHTQ